MSDVVIIGGGVIGLLMARELAHAGAKVTLVEKGECGRESSWAGGGIVSPLSPWRYSPAVTALARAAQHAYPRLAKVLWEETGIDPQWEPCGLLMLDAPDAQEAVAWAADVGSRLSRVDQSQVYAQEPSLAPGFTHGLWMPDIANIRNPRLLKSLLASVRALPGVSLLEHADVYKFDTEDGAGAHVTGVRIRHQGTDRQVSGDRFVVAAGAWSGRLLDGIVTALPVYPVKGQMLLYHPDRPLVHSIVLTKGRYAIPRRDNMLLIGSTLEHADFDKSTTQEALQSLQASAIDLLPALAQYAPVAQWAGLRPGAPEGIPFIGRLPAWQNLYVNAGHFRNGLVLAPASAGLLCDLLLRRIPRVDPSPYDPALRAAG